MRLLKTKSSKEAHNNVTNNNDNSSKDFSPNNNYLQNEQSGFGALQFYTEASPGEPD